MSVCTSHPVPFNDVAEELESHDEETTQGGRAVQAGKVSENAVESVFKTLRYRKYTYKEWVMADRPQHSCLVTHYPYPKWYGRKGYSEFVVYPHPGAAVGPNPVRVEARWQSVSGSADEKMPNLLNHAYYHYPEETVVLVIDGPGFHSELIDQVEDSIEWFNNQRKNAAPGRQRDGFGLQVPDIPDTKRVERVDMGGWLEWAKENLS